MKNNLKQIFASLLCASLFFSFSVSADAADLISDTIASLDNSENYDIIEYDYITKTERVIPWESISDYSSTTTTTYELDSYHL